MGHKYLTVAVYDKIIMAYIITETQKNKYQMHAQNVDILQTKFFAKFTNCILIIICRLSKENNLL